jgi:thiosulfate/3-mercaptopyruvate sulfurtransferase
MHPFGVLHKVLEQFELGGSQLQFCTQIADPVGGRIPGARNRFFRDNLQADGRFKPAPQLRSEFLALLDGLSPDQSVHQCGSGVSACHNILAMEVAGMSGMRLYPGSWSEWCADASRPIASGEPAALEIPKPPRT